MKGHVFQAWIRVTDPGALWEAAMSHALGERALSPEEAEELLGVPDDPDVDGCLWCLFDPIDWEGRPGYEILGTEADKADIMELCMKHEAWFDQADGPCPQCHPELYTEVTS